MNEGISSRLRYTFLIHMIVSAIMGAALFLIPGRTLTLVGWVQEMVTLPESELAVPGGTFVDPLITRLLGAALLALAFASFQGWRAKSWGQVSLLVQMEAVFCVLGVAAFIVVTYTISRNPAGRVIPIAFWVDLVILAAFAVAWGIALQKGE